MGPPPSEPAAHQPHVPEATHHAGTANVTSAIAATSAMAVPRLVIQLLIVTGHLLGSSCHAPSVPRAKSQGTGSAHAERIIRVRASPTRITGTVAVTRTAAKEQE